MSQQRGVASCWPRAFVVVSALAIVVACDGATGTAGPVGPEGPRGPEGPQGPAGDPSDGGARLRLYGDGRDGALVVAAGETAFVPVESTGQYTSITIATGGTLLLLSGTLLRVTGDVDNDGTIRVNPGAYTGVQRYGSPMADLAPSQAPAHPGVALSSAEFGSVDMTAPFVAYGGQGGRGIARAARWATQLLPYAGGAGALSWPFLATATLSGGGSLHIRSGGEIRNAGTIEARGVSGGSLGGSDCGIGGGGGGGGFVHLIAPQIDGGELQVDGGQAGTAGAYGTLRWIGGSGGGGSAGDGGRGTGRVDATVSAANGGGAGESFVITADPASVL